jgi:NAD+ kinase
LQYCYGCTGSKICRVRRTNQVVKSAGYEEPIIIKKYKKPAVFVRLKKRGLRQMSKLGF